MIQGRLPCASERGHAQDVGGWCGLKPLWVKGMPRTTHLERRQEAPETGPVGGLQTGGWRSAWARTMGHRAGPTVTSVPQGRPIDRYPPFRSGAGRVRLPPRISHPTEDGMQGRMIVGLMAALVAASPAAAQDGCDHAGGLGRLRRHEERGHRGDRAIRAHRRHLEGHARARQQEGRGRQLVDRDRARWHRAAGRGDGVAEAARPAHARRASSRARASSSRATRCRWTR